MRSIDPAKRFLTQEDVDRLSPYEMKIDDQISNRSFDFFDLAEKLIAEGIRKSELFYQESMAQEFDIHSSKDSLVVNADDRGFARNDQELHDYWQKLIQYETVVKVHGLKKAQSEDEEVKDDETLIKEARENISENFDEWFKRLKSLRRSDRFEDYLNAITNAYDPHSNYFSPREKENFDLNMNGQL